MNAGQSEMVIQLSLWEAIIDLLIPGPFFFLGIVIVGLLLTVMLRGNPGISKGKTIIVTFMMYYYLQIVFGKVVGIPTISEFSRISKLGQNLFNPNINLIPFSDGLSLSFLLNIFLFIPLGFLCPMLSKTYYRFKNVILAGAMLSLVIEISQLFTLYRATDIDDLLTNVVGAGIGYFCFAVAVMLGIVKPYSRRRIAEKAYFKYLPYLIMAIAFLMEFIS